MSKKFRRGVEIGAGDSFSSELWKRRADFMSIDLYEPNRFLVRDLRDKTLGLSNVKVHEVAVSDSNRQEKFYHLGYTSYLQSADSPIKLYCNAPLDATLDGVSAMVKVMDAAEIEGDDIDVLSLTCNGSEMKILERLRVRPVVIEMKCFTHVSRHQAYCLRIFDWMNTNRYTPTITYINKYRVRYHVKFYDQNHH